jgi:hypothetical protein
LCEWSEEVCELWFAQLQGQQREQRFATRAKIPLQNSKKSIFSIIRDVYGPTFVGPVTFVSTDIGEKEKRKRLKK